MTDQERAAELYPYTEGSTNNRFTDALRGAYLKKCEDEDKEMIELIEWMQHTDYDYENILTQFKNRKQTNCKLKEK